MKAFVGFCILTFLSVSVFADEAPSWWQLPQKGKNCVLQNSFTDGQITCGTHAYEVWSCVTPSENSFSSASSRQYLIVGEYHSDSSNTCSPTFVVKTVIKQN